MNCECCKEQEAEFFICVDCIEAFPWHYHEGRKHRPITTWSGSP